MSTDFFGRAWSAMATRAVAYFPTILATAALLLVGVAISFLLGVMARRVARRFGLDRRIEEGGLSGPLSRAGLSVPTSQIIGRLVFWLVFLCFLVLALENLGLDLAQLPVRTFVAYVPRLIGALILLIAGFLLAALVGRAADAGMAGIGISHHERLAGVLRWVLVAVTVIATVDHLGFDVRVLTDTFRNLLTIVAAGIALAFAWGGKEVARNLLAGHYARDSFSSGETLVVGGQQGRLEEIGTLSARLATARGALVVPNSRLIEAEVETVEQTERESS